MKVHLTSRHFAAEVLCSFIWVDLMSCQFEVYNRRLDCFLKDSIIHPAYKIYERLCFLQVHQNAAKSSLCSVGISLVLAASHLFIGWSCQFLYIYIETSIYSCWSFSSVACLNSFVLLLWYRMLMLELFIHPVGTLWRFFTKSCLSVYCFKKPLVLITRWYYAISFFQRAKELDVTFYDRLKNFLYVVNVMKCGINFVIYEVFNLFICLFE